MKDYLSQLRKSGESLLIFTFLCYFNFSLWTLQKLHCSHESTYSEIGQFSLQTSCRQVETKLAALVFFL